jgi:RluA family pseudouridine synthase
VVGLIHRLDREASGLLVFSKNRRAYDSLKTQFFKHTVERVYLARVRGKVQPTRGKIESRLIERADGTVRSTTQHAKGQRAISEYEVIEQKGGGASVEVRLLTGRKHQIRVHLSERGWPIVGDRVYGDPKDSQPLQLRAVRLALDHPQTGKRITFERG